MLPMKKYRQRIYYTEADKALMWDRWQKGESLHTIARLFDRYHTSVQRILAETGGILQRKDKGYWHDYLVDGKPVVKPFDVEKLPPGFNRLVDTV